MVSNLKTELAISGDRILGSLYFIIRTISLKLEQNKLFIWSLRQILTSGNASVCIIEYKAMNQY